MSQFVALGPKLGLLINANAGAQVADQFRPLLRAFDALLFASVLSSTTTVPPSSPNNGDAYLLLRTPTGAWAGHQYSIAVWSTAITTFGTDTQVPGWDFWAPNEGWSVWDTAASAMRVFTAGGWTLLTLSGGSGSNLPPLIDTATTKGYQLEVVNGALTVVPSDVLVDSVTGSCYQITITNGAMTLTPVSSTPGAPSSLSFIDTVTGLSYALSIQNGAETLTPL